jgi:DinB superfamily
MTTVMCRSAVATPIAKIFALNDDLAARALDGLTKEQLWTPPTGRNNPMLWVVGHFVETRAQLLGLLGEPIDTGWGERFTRGATLGDVTRYPLREEVERIMSDVSRQLQAKLAVLDDQQLSRPPAVEMAGAATVADQVALFAFHDSYHVGQMAYIRKALGYPALAG